MTKKFLMTQFSADYNQLYVRKLEKRYHFWLLVRCFLSKQFFSSIATSVVTEMRIRT